MSGLRSYARKGKVRIKATVIFDDTGRRAKVHLFVKNNITETEVAERLTAKYGKKLLVGLVFDRRGVQLFRKVA